MFFKKKIITLLTGGIGNQFFQYAASKALQKKNQNFNCFYILRTNPSDSPYLVEGLKLFLNINIKKKEEKLTFIKKITQKIIEFFFYKILDKNDVNFTLVPKKNLYYLLGYFQNISWYKNVLNDVCDEIIYKNQKKFDKFKDSELVIHFRRGDFLTLGWLLSLEYYYEALKIINKNKDKKITLVSEDIQFNELFYEKLKKEGYSISPIKYNDNFAKIENDFNIITKSKNLILSNSTLAWWAASVRSRIGYENKSVVIPKYWYPQIDGVALVYGELKPEVKLHHPGNPYSWIEIENSFYLNSR